MAGIEDGGWKVEDWGRGALFGRGILCRAAEWGMGRRARRSEENGKRAKEKGKRIKRAEDLEDFPSFGNLESLVRGMCCYYLATKQY
jgi:hypothetical protein